MLVITIILIITANRLSEFKVLLIATMCLFLAITPNVGVITIISVFQIKKLKFRDAM